MIREPSPEIGDDGNGAGGGGGDGKGLNSIRGRFRWRRNFPHAQQRDHSRTSLDRPSVRNRSHQNRFGRKIFPVKGSSMFYCLIICAVFAFALASMVMQNSIMSVFMPGSDQMKMARKGLRSGNMVKFEQPRRFFNGTGLDRRRSDRRIGVRAPQVALVLGNMDKDPSSLMLFTVMKNLQTLGYSIKIYAVENGEQALSVWEQIDDHVSFILPEQYDLIDWSIYEGVVAGSLEAKEAISSLMQEPFCSVPLVWIIQEDILGNRLFQYEELGWKHLVSHWRSAFRRADVVVFPDFSLPMLYSVLDTGNFFVIPGSPIDVWAAESFSKTHSKYKLRQDNGLSEDDVLVVIVGSSLYYNDLSWDSSVSVHAFESLLIKYATKNDADGSFIFAFLSGNSSDRDDDILQDISSRLGLLPGSIRHFGMNNDVNSVLLMADIVLYGSSQDEQSFPSVLIRAMTFGVPVVAPDLPIIEKYVVNGVHMVLFSKYKANGVMKAFSLLISDGKLSKFAITVSSSGRLLSKNMLASECITYYARLLENVIKFPSDASLPDSISNLQKGAWEWNVYRKEIEQGPGELPELYEKDYYSKKSSVVHALEDELKDLLNPRNILENGTEILVQDFTTALDWDVLTEIESSEELEQLEMEELEERTEKDSGVWDDIYRTARKSEKLKFETNERDEGELERVGQPVCIYEIYDGAGAWPLLHHGSLYRGLSLSTGARRLKSDDVDAVERLPLLNETYYRDILCEIGGMFSIANRVDNVHKRPWIGFQSWRAAGRKVSLSKKAEKVLEETIQQESRGDTIYFWARLGMDGGVAGSNEGLTFWSLCDVLNGGYCRNAFEDAFRHMYNLPLYVDALPPMPEDSGYWSSLHSWVMPTPSFMEFVMFSRMFVDALDMLKTNSTKANSCLLGSSYLEKKQCYCRVLEILVNVWVYHSGRKIVYMDPHTGLLKEQHRVEQRRGFMWTKYFTFEALKSMDEALAEAADDNDHPREAWLWPLTGEVHWQGIYEREREDRYRLKMDKKRKTREKLFERMKHGYKQKAIGR